MELVNSEPTDNALLEAWRSGDRDAGDRLVSRHFDDIYRFFAHKVPDRASDLVQDTFVGLVEARERFRGDASVRTFLFAIARNVLLKHFESRHKDPVDFSVSSIEDLAPSPSSLLRRKEAEAVLVYALRRIPIDLQIALELHYWEGLTGPALAVVLDLTEPAVRSRLRRGREKLHAELARIDRNDERWQTEETLEAWARDLRPYTP